MLTGKTGFADGEKCVFSNLIYTFLVDDYTDEYMSISKVFLT